MSSLTRPVRSGPNRTPQGSPAAKCTRISAAALARRHLAPDHVAVARGRGVDMRRGRRSPPRRRVEPRPVEHRVGPARRRHRPLVGPPVARPHEPQIVEPAIHHRPRRRADILPELGLDQDDRRPAVDPVAALFGAGHRLVHLHRWERCTPCVSSGAGEPGTMNSGLWNAASGSVRRPRHTMGGPRAVARRQSDLPPRSSALPSAASSRRCSRHRRSAVPYRQPIGRHTPSSSPGGAERAALGASWVRYAPAMPGLPCVRPGSHSARVCN